MRAQLNKFIMAAFNYKTNSFESQFLVKNNVEPEDTTSGHGKQHNTYRTQAQYDTTMLRYENRSKDARRHQATKNIKLEKEQDNQLLKEGMNAMGAKLQQSKDRHAHNAMHYLLRKQLRNGFKITSIKDIDWDKFNYPNKQRGYFNEYNTIIVKRGVDSVFYYRNYTEVCKEVSEMWEIVSRKGYEFKAIPNIWELTDRGIELSYHDFLKTADVNTVPCLSCGNKFTVSSKMPCNCVAVACLQQHEKPSKHVCNKLYYDTEGAIHRACPHFMFREVSEVKELLKPKLPTRIRYNVPTPKYEVPPPLTILGKPILLKMGKEFEYQAAISHIYNLEIPEEVILAPGIAIGKEHDMFIESGLSGKINHKNFLLFRIEPNTIEVMKAYNCMTHHDKLMTCSDCKTPKQSKVFFYIKREGKIEAFNHDHQFSLKVNDKQIYIYSKNQGFKISDKDVVATSPVNSPVGQHNKPKEQRRCKVCEVTFRSEQEARKHLESKEHILNTQDPYAIFDYQSGATGTTPGISNYKSISPPSLRPVDVGTWQYIKEKFSSILNKSWDFIANTIGETMYDVIINTFGRKLKEKFPALRSLGAFMLQLSPILISIITEVRPLSILVIVQYALQLVNLLPFLGKWICQLLGDIVPSTLKDLFTEQSPSKPETSEMETNTESAPLLNDVKTAFVPTIIKSEEQMSKIEHQKFLLAKGSTIAIHEDDKVVKEVIESMDSYGIVIPHSVLSHEVKLLIHVEPYLETVNNREVMKVVVHEFSFPKGDMDKYKVIKVPGVVLFTENVANVPNEEGSVLDIANEDYESSYFDEQSGCMNKYQKILENACEQIPKFQEQSDITASISRMMEVISGVTLKEVGLMATSMNSIVRLLTTFKDFLMWIISFLPYLWQKKLGVNKYYWLDQFKDPKSDYNKFMFVTRTLTSNINNKIPILYEHIEAWKTSYYAILDSMKASPPSTTQIATFIQECRVVLMHQHKAQQRTMQPVCFWMVGGSGIGKSTILPYMARQIFRPPEDMENHQIMFTRNTTDEYWSGYNPKTHRVTILDDFMAYRDKQDPDADAADIIKIVNNATFVMPLAELSDKGTTFQSQALWLTSNKDNYNIEGLTHKDAFWNRIHLQVEARAVAPVKGDGSHLRFKILKIKGKDHAKENNCAVEDHKRLGSFCTTCKRFVHEDNLTMADIITWHKFAIAENINIASENNKITKTESYVFAEDKDIRDIDNMLNEHLKSNGTFYQSGTQTSVYLKSSDEEEDSVTFSRHVRAPSYMDWIKRKKGEVIDNLKTWLSKKKRQFKRMWKVEDLMATVGLGCIEFLDNANETLYNTMNIVNNIATGAYGLGFIDLKYLSIWKILWYGLNIMNESFMQSIGKDVGVILGCSLISVAIGATTKIFTKEDEKVFENQSYTNATPRHAQRQGKVFKTQSGESNAIDKVCKNMGRIFVEVDEEISNTSQILFVGNHKAITTAHTFAINGRFEKSYKVILRCYVNGEWQEYIGTVTKPIEHICNYTTNDKMDCVIVDFVELNIPAFKKITQHFYYADDFPMTETISSNMYALSNSGITTIYQGEVKPMKDNIPWVGKDEDYYTIRTLRGKWHTKSGDCGAVVVDERTNKIMGIHFGYRDYVSYALVIFRDQFVDNAILDASQPDKLIHLQSGTIEEPYLHGTNIFCTGQLKKEERKFLPVETDIEPSPLYESMYKHTTEPAILSVSDKRNVNHISPLINGMKTLNGPRPGRNIEASDFAKECLYQQLRRYKGYHAITELEAINGSPFYSHLTAMDLTTSAGYGYKTTTGKKELFTKQENGLWVVSDPILRQRIDEIYYNVKNNIVSTPIIQTQVKDERRKLAKIEQVLSRVFYMWPTEYIVAGRKILGTFFEYFFSNYKVSGQHSCVGMDPYSDDFDSLVTEMTTFSRYGWDGDFKAFDQSLLMWILIDIIEVWTKLAHNPKEVSVYFETFMQEILLVLEQVYILSASNTSGSILTTAYNTDANYYIMAAAWYMLAPPKYRTVMAFRENVLLKVYGDDQWVAVKEKALEFYNFKTVKLAIKALFYMEYTDGSKSKIERPYMLTTECSFLKNRIGKLNGRYVAVLDFEVIAELTNWIRVPKRFRNSEEYRKKQLQENLMAASRFMYFHGPTAYNKFRDKVYTITDDYFIPPYSDYDGIFKMYGCLALDYNPYKRETIQMNEEQRSIIWQQLDYDHLYM